MAIKEDTNAKQSIEPMGSKNKKIRDSAAEKQQRRVDRPKTGDQYTSLNT